MPATLIDGKAIAEKLNQKTATRIATHLPNHQRAHELAVILLGQNPASEVYVRHKLKACTKVGIISRSFLLPMNTSEAELLKLIEELNLDPTLDGILVQLPLPEHINANAIL